MSVACDQLTEVASAGVAPALRAVDCLAAETTTAAFSRLFGASGAMGPVLTIVLTLYIAFFAISLLTGRSRLGISALTPRMLTLGLVLTFATSWIAYQSVVWNLAVGGPDWIASILMGANGSATQIFGDRIDIVFAAVADISGQTSGQGGAAGEAAGGAVAAASGGGLFSPDSVMWMGALMLMLGTVGILLTARIALAVLLALGPVFVVMALFGGTRGLTAGWLRGVAMTAVTPLFVVLGGGITMELLLPVIRALGEGANAGAIDGRAAMAFFLVAAVHLALMGMVLKVAGTLVSGWKVFGLADSARASASSPAAPVAAPMHAAQTAGSMVPASSASRSAALMAASHASASSAPGGDNGSPNNRSSDRRTVVTQVSGGGIEPLRPDSNSRARGIGSRFRSPSNDTGRKPVKEIIR